PPVYSRSIATLHRQKRFGSVRRQVGVEGVDEQRQQTVVPHDQTELDDSLAAELLQRCLKRPTADPVSPEEFAAVVHHRRLVGRRTGKLLAVTQGVDDLAADAGLARGGRMRVPD